MTPSAERHLQRKPHARPSTLQLLEKRDETTARLREEIAQAEADKRVNEFRDSIGYRPGPNALMLIAGKLKVLAARLVQ